MEDILFKDKNLQIEYENKNPWAQFIIHNKTNEIFTQDFQNHTQTKNEKDLNLDYELIKDFEYINDLVLNKLKNYK
jgi:hypothetical protein